MDHCIFLLDVIQIIGGHQLKTELFAEVNEGPVHFPWPSKPWFSNSKKVAREPKTFPVPSSGFLRRLIIPSAISCLGISPLKQAEGRSRPWRPAANNSQSPGPVIEAFQVG